MIFGAFLKVIVIVQVGVDAVCLKFISTEPDKAINLIISNRLISLIDAFPGSGERSVAAGGVLERFVGEFHAARSEDEPELLLVKEGQMVFTPPMIDHGMKFPEDTVFLTLSRNPRDQATYEADVVRVDMLDDSDTISWRPEDDD